MPDDAADDGAWLAFAADGYFSGTLYESEEGQLCVTRERHECLPGNPFHALWRPPSLTCSVHHNPRHRRTSPTG